MNTLRRSWKEWKATTINLFSSSYLFETGVVYPPCSARYCYILVDDETRPIWVKTIFHADFLRSLYEMPDGETPLLFTLLLRLLPANWECFKHSLVNTKPFRSSSQNSTSVAIAPAFVLYTQHSSGMALMLFFCEINRVTFGFCVSTRVFRVVCRLKSNVDVSWLWRPLMLEISI